MGEIKDFVDLITLAVKRYEIVTEFEQGLLFRCGKAVEKRVRWFGEDLEEIVKAEQIIINEHGGKWSIIGDYLFGRKHNYPDDFRRNWLGLPRHKDRDKKDKNLKAGLYFKWPLIDDIVTINCQEDVLNLGDVGVLTIDDPPIAMYVSPNVRLEVLNFYKLYTAVRNHETSLSNHILSILAECSRGYTFQEWKGGKQDKEGEIPFYTALEKRVLKDVREIVTEDWGLKIHEIKITHAVPASYQKMIYEGTPITPHKTMLRRLVEGDLAETS